MSNSNLLAQKCNKKAQAIVIKLIETTVEASELQHLCCFITPGQFEDICLERCIAGTCGYPLCKRQHSDKHGSRQYIIRNKAVYDITRRRNFCSSVCFEASLRLLSQIPNSPLYLRGQGENERSSIVLPDLSKLEGMHGDKVNINSSKPLSDADTLDSKQNNAKSNHSDSPRRSNIAANANDKNRRKNKPKKLTSDNNEPQEQDVFKSNVDTKSVVNNTVNEKNDITDESSVVESVFESRSDAPQTQHTAAAAPHPCTVTSLQAPAAAPASSLSSATADAVAQVEDHLRQWLRWPSFLLLLGPKELQLRCRLASSSFVGDDDSTFVSRAARVRSLHSATLAKVEAFYKGTDCYAEAPEDEQIESGLPLIDQHNISSWRRNIFLQKLEPCERSLVARLQLPREEVRQKLKAVALTLCLTQHNLHLRPAQWALVTLALLKLISFSCEEVREAFMDDTALQAEVLPRLFVLGMSLPDLDALVSRLSQTPALRKAYIEHQKLHASSHALRDNVSLISEVSGGSCGGEQDAGRGKFEETLLNIEALSIYQEKSNSSVAHMTSCIYSETDTLD